MLWRQSEEEEEEEKYEEKRGENADITVPWRTDVKCMKKMEFVEKERKKGEMGRKNREKGQKKEQQMK